MNVIRVNGRTINVPDGSSVSVINNCVYIDGKQVDEEIVSKKEVIVKLVIEGKIENLVVDANVECQEVGGYLKADGNVTAGNVGGYLKAGGNVACVDVQGNIKAEGNVVARNVAGSVQAGGNLIYGRR